MVPCEILQQLFDASPASRAFTGEAAPADFCSLTGRYCTRSTYAGYAVAQKEQRCPARALLGVLLLVAVANARGEAAAPRTPIA